MLKIALKLGQGEQDIVVIEGLCRLEILEGLIQYSTAFLPFYQSSNAIPILLLWFQAL